MSLHSSLKASGMMKRHRSVLSRLERVKILQERGLLNLEESSLLGLPKVKHLKIRVKKERAAAPAPEAAVAASPGEAGAAAAPAPGAKPAAKTPGLAAQKPVAPGPAKPEVGAQLKKKE